MAQDSQSGGSIARIAALITLLVAIGFAWLYFSAASDLSAVRKELADTNDQLEAEKANLLSAQQLTGLLVGGYVDQVSREGVTPQTREAAVKIANALNATPIEEIPADRAETETSELQRLGAALYNAGAYDEAKVVLTVVADRAQVSLNEDAYSQYWLVKTGESERYLGEIAEQQDNLNEYLLRFRRANWAWDQLLRLVEEKPEWMAYYAYNAMKIGEGLTRHDSIPNAYDSYAQSWRYAQRLLKDQYGNVFNQVRDSYAQFLRSQGDNKRAEEIMAQ